MPSSANYVGNIRGVFTLADAGQSKISHAPTGALPVYVAPTYDSAPAELVRRARAKAKSVLPALASLPESMDMSVNANGTNLPKLVLNVTEAQDISANFGVFSVATMYSLDFILVYQIATDGTTDSALTNRVLLTNLMQAFMADPHLGGLCVDTEVVTMPGNKATTYAQQYFSDAQYVGVLVLTMQFVIELIWGSGQTF